MEKNEALRGNPYIGSADTDLSYYSYPMNEYYVAQAVLALAFEQRTANFEQRTTNLIAWHAFVDAQGDLPDESADLAKQIIERLGH